MYIVFVFNHCLKFTNVQQLKAKSQQPITNCQHPTPFNSSIQTAD